MDQSGAVLGKSLLSQVVPGQRQDHGVIKKALQAGSVIFITEWFIEPCPGNPAPITAHVRPARWGQGVWPVVRRRMPIVIGISAGGMGGLVQNRVGTPQKGMFSLFPKLFNECVVKNACLFTGHHRFPDDHGCILPHSDLCLCVQMIQQADHGLNPCQSPINLALNWILLQSLLT